MNLINPRLHVFSTLLTGATVTGFIAACYLARRFAISREEIARFSLCMVVPGALGAILFKLVYLPEALARGLGDPLRLLYHRPGISSFGAGWAAGGAFIVKFGTVPAISIIRVGNAASYASAAVPPGETVTLGGWARQPARMGSHSRFGKPPRLNLPLA